MNYSQIDFTKPYDISSVNLPIFGNVDIFVFFGFVLVFLLLTIIFFGVRNRSKHLPDNKTLLLKTVCGGRVMGRYETMPNIKLLFYDKFLIVADSLDKITVNYNDIKDVRRSFSDNIFVRFHMRIFPTLIGGGLSVIANIFLKFFFLSNSDFPYASIASIIIIILSNIFLGKINIWENLRIIYNKNGDDKEISIYPARIDKAYDLLIQKTGLAVINKN